MAASISNRSRNNAAAAKANQPFLANAQDGDVLIVYQNAGVAVLYRSSSNKIIAVGPVNTTAGSQSQITPAPSAPTPDATTNTTKK